MEYQKLAAIYAQLESTTKRLEKTYYVAELLKTTPREDLEHLTLLIQGKIYPDYDERKIGVASRLVLKSMEVASGMDAGKIEDNWKETGDLGETAKHIISR